jgi:hypothetical protein
MGMTFRKSFASIVDGIRKLQILNTRSALVIQAIPAFTGHNFLFRSRSAFPTTETELKLIAALAMMGLRRIPKNG